MAKAVGRGQGVRGIGAGGPNTSPPPATGVYGQGGPHSPGVIGRAGTGPADRVEGTGTGNFSALCRFGGESSGTGVFGVGGGQGARASPISATTDHVPDVWFAPHLAILGTRIPPDALSKMKTFEGDHLLHKQITEERVATAWIGRDVIFGGEFTNKTKDAGTTTQFIPPPFNGELRQARSVGYGSSSRP